ncbi:MAG: DUF2490 domain-containing protein [Sphingomonadales bacterium]|nr:MAG: DUF2490 domain-containing protein [Sphingomonadales bacterium]
MLRLMLPFAMIATPAAAQRVDEQLWLQANGAVAVSASTTVTLEAIGRFADSADGFAHSEFGGIVSHKLSKTVEIGLGYRHVQDYDHGRLVPNEERLRQQVTFTLGSGFSTRSRFEQTLSSAGPGAALRWRQQLRFTQPIGKGVSAFASHESFLNLNDRRQRSGYDRMRNMIGLQIPLADKLTGEVGYLNQYRFGRDGRRDQMDHVASVSLSFNLASIHDSGD